jgi:hypothetical protein
MILPSSSKTWKVQLTTRPRASMTGETRVITASFTAITSLLAYSR